MAGEKRISGRKKEQPLGGVGKQKKKKNRFHFFNGHVQREERNTSGKGFRELKEGS